MHLLSLLLLLDGQFFLTLLDSLREQCVGFGVSKLKIEMPTKKAKYVAAVCVALFNRK